jgi:predicted RNA-binding protein with PUA-like domain
LIWKVVIIAEKNEQYWLVKFAPFRTSWTDVVRRGTFTFRGVRNAQARNNLASMRVGDPVFFYHSQQQLAVVGLMEVTRESYPDPTSTDPQWLTCDFKPVQTLLRSVALAEIKTNPVLSNLPLVIQPRLSVMPVTPTEFEEILEIGSKI